MLIEANRKEMRAARTALPRSRDMCFRQMQNIVYDISRMQSLPDQRIVTEIGRHFAVAKNATEFIIVAVSLRAERFYKE